MLAHCDTYVVVLQRDSDPLTSVSLCSVWSDDFSQSQVGRGLYHRCYSVGINNRIRLSKITAVSAPPDARQNYDRRTGYGRWRREESIIRVIINLEPLVISTNKKKEKRK
jgi:hypothetical protein